MNTEFETTGKQVDVHYVNGGVPSIIEETVEGYYIEHRDLSLEELLQDQEVLYQSFQTNTRSDKTKASGSSDTSPGHDHSGYERRIVEKEGESSQVHDFDSQLDSDEAFARSLQELEIRTSVGETTDAANTTSGFSTDNSDPSPSDTTAVVMRQDNIDPDDMTYEEIRSLGEAIGIEDRGLSEELISYLQSFEYRRGLFSREDIDEKCVICCTEYEDGDILIRLPCQHQYHSDCVTTWLKLNKPVLKEKDPRCSRGQSIISLEAEHISIGGPSFLYALEVHRMWAVVGLRFLVHSFMKFHWVVAAMTYTTVGCNTHDSNSYNANGLYPIVKYNYTLPYSHVEECYTPVVAVITGLLSKRRRDWLIKRPRVIHVALNRAKVRDMEKNKFCVMLRRQFKQPMLAKIG